MDNPLSDVMFFLGINKDAFSDYMEYLDQRFQPNVYIQFDFQRYHMNGNKNFAAAMGVLEVKNPDEPTTGKYVLTFE